MAGSQKQRKGIGGLDPDPESEQEVHISATACGDRITLSYSLHDARDHKKACREPPTGAGPEPAPKPQPKKCYQVCRSLVLARKPTEIQLGCLGHDGTLCPSSRYASRCNFVYALP